MKPGHNKPSLLAQIITGIVLVAGTATAFTLAIMALMPVIQAAATSTMHDMPAGEVWFRIIVSMIGILIGGLCIKPIISFIIVVIEDFLFEPPFSKE